MSPFSEETFHDLFTKSSTDGAAQFHHNSSLILRNDCVNFSDITTEMVLKNSYARGLIEHVSAINVLLSKFYPESRLYPNFIQILFRLFRNSLYSDFIQILP